MPDTGWCPTCSGIIEGELTNVVCVRCKTVFQSRGEFICNQCKEDDWANEIEQLMVLGVSFTRAKLLVAKNNQAVCLCCGETMPRATKGRHLFCTNHKQCKSASRRVKHLRLDKGMNKEAALTIVLREIEFVKNQISESTGER